MTSVFTDKDLSQILIDLRDASMCNNPACDFYIKQQWNHVVGCHDETCAGIYCQTMNHYKICNQKCGICNRVRDAIRENYYRKSSLQKFTEMASR